MRNIPGGVYFTEPIRRIFSRQRRRVSITDFDARFTMALDLSEHMQGHIFWYGCYNRDIIALLDKVLRNGMLFIDVGANVGEISLAAANRVGECGQVIAFEPVPDLADRLSQHVEVNGLKNVRVVRKALSDRSGQAIIYAPDAKYRDGTDNDGLGTLFPSEAVHEPRSRVSLMTLDQFAALNLIRVDVIKLDIEGGELAALRGAANVLATYGPDLIVELSEEGCRAAGHIMMDVVSFLRAQGYSLYSIRRRGELEPLRDKGLSTSQNVYCVKTREITSVDG